MHPKHFFTTLTVLLAVLLQTGPIYLPLVWISNVPGSVSICDEAHFRTALADGGNVTFTCSGTITLTARITIAADTTIDGSGQAVTISGNHTVRVFTVNSGVTLNLIRLTVANGSAVDGGGVHNSGTTTVSNSTFSDNRGGQDFAKGGGIYNLGTLIVSDSTFSGNRASGATDGVGGGIFNLGQLTVSNSTFSANSASRGGGGIFNYNGTTTVSNSTFSGNGGGGISNSGQLIVTNSAFSANLASRGGGGIYNSTGLATVSNSTFSANRAWYSSGGGIYNRTGTVTVSNSTFSANRGSSAAGGILNGGTLTVRNCTLSDNSADNGGGIYNVGGGDVTVTNSTFSGNLATRLGGGIFNGDGKVTVGNSTFSDNGATDFGGGIFNEDYALSVTVINSTFSNNSARSGGDFHNRGLAMILKNTVVVNSVADANCSGIITDGGGNLSYPDTICPGINRDPMLGPLQNNGGPTETMALGPGSAAIDAGNNAICAAEPVNNLDQRGIVRPQGPQCDIGAVEQQMPQMWLPATRSQ